MTSFKKYKILNGNNALESSAEYGYYADGVRSYKKIGTDSTEFYYDNGNIVSEYTNGTYSAANIFGPEGIIYRTSVKDGEMYYMLNQHKDVESLYNQNGTEIATTEYDEYGNIKSSSGNVFNPFKHSGEYQDEESGLVYLRARYYSPEMRRFISEDTLQGDISNPLSLNRFGYVHGNPLRYSDPTGHRPGDRYSSAEEAAENWAQTYNGLSINTNMEYGSTIYTATEVINANGDKSQFYSYSEPAVGNRNGVSPSVEPVGTTAVGTIHSHGAFEILVELINGIYTNDGPSPKDFANLIDFGVNFLITSAGVLLGYSQDREGRHVSEIDRTVSLPFDHNRPDKGGGEPDSGCGDPARSVDVFTDHEFATHGVNHPSGSDLSDPHDAGDSNTGGDSDTGGDTDTGGGYVDNGNYL